MVKPTNPSGWILVDKKDLRLKGRDSNNKRYEGVWDYADLYGVSAWLNEELDEQLVSFKEAGQGGQYFMAFSVKPDSEKAQKHWDTVKTSIDSIKNGIGRSKDGDSCTWQALAPDFTPPREWGLDFPDGEIWILTQKG